MVQWLYGMKVNWTTIGLDGEMVDGLSPVYDFLYSHTLCHRYQPVMRSEPAPFVTGIAANHFGSGQSRFIQGHLRSNEVKVNLAASQEERLAHMGVGKTETSFSPPPKIAKTNTVSSCVMKPIAILAANFGSKIDKEIEDSKIKEPDSGFQEADSIDIADRKVSHVEVKSNGQSNH